MIEDAVKSFLTTEHTGVLMISGDWGTGKSYFVKHRLLDVIGAVECLDPSDYPKGIVNEKIQKFITQKGSCYIPVMVSLFGKGSIKELESEIIGKLLSNLNDGVTYRKEYIYNVVGKLVKKSNKLNEYFDFASLFEYHPGVNVLPKRVVIVLDDLERFDDKISETEILGFINNLSENLGLKVIVIANEDYLNTDKDKFGVFKEKVVEKTLYYSPNIQNIAKEMIKSLKDDDFNDFVLSSSLILNSFYLSEEKRRIEGDYHKCLCNLRTLKFAINHFRIVFNLIKDYALAHNQSPEEYNEELEHLGVSIVAISIEMKSYRLTHEMIPSFADYHYFASGEILFDDVSAACDNITGTSVKEESKDRIGVQVNGETMSLPRYKMWFYEYYFRRRQCGLLPIASPGLLYYLIDGIPPVAENLIKDYRCEKEILVPTKVDGDKLLSQFVNEISSMDNKVFAENLNALFEEVMNGRLTNLTDFVNATAILITYKEILHDHLSTEPIVDKIKSGVDHWFKSNDLSESTVSRFDSVRDVISDDDRKTIYNHIAAKIEERNRISNEQEIMAIFDSFAKDLGEFCRGICSSIAEYESGPHYSNKWMAMNPVLNQLDDKVVKKKIQEITISEVNILRSLLEFRYISANSDKLKNEEYSFWEIVSDTIENSTGSSAGLIYARNVLLSEINKTFAF